MNNQRIENEIEVLSNIFLDKIHVIPSNKPYNKTIEIALVSNPLHLQDNERPFCSIKIRFQCRDTYPSSPPLILFIDHYNWTDSEIEVIRSEINIIIKEKVNENLEMLHDICNHIQVYLNQKHNLNNPDSKEIENNNNNNNNNPNVNLCTQSHSQILHDNNSNNIALNDEEHSLPQSATLGKDIPVGWDLSKNSELNNVISNTNSSCSVTNSEQIRNYQFRFRSDFEIIQRLGEGGGGTVFQVKHKLDKYTYAIKVIRVNIYNPQDNEKVLSKVLNECYVFSRLQHKHIVRYIQTWVEEYDEATDKWLQKGSLENSLFSVDCFSDDVKTKFWFIQMEYCPGKTLRDVIEHNKFQNETHRWKLIRQISEALLYIHDNKLIHRDLKPGNIFLSRKSTAKLGDFGLAKDLLKNSEWEIETKSTHLHVNDDIFTFNIGTKHYISPEQDKKGNEIIYNNKTDMFSLGIIIFEMFYKFRNWMIRDKTLKKIKEEHKFPEDFNIPNFKENIIEWVKNLTENNPEKRMDCKQWLNSPLWPAFHDEKQIITHFEKIINENKIDIWKFIDILIKSACKESIDSTVNNNNWIGIKELSINDFIKDNQVSDDSANVFLQLFNEFIMKAKGAIPNQIVKLYTNQVSRYFPYINIYDSIKNQWINIFFDEIYETMHKDDEEIMLRKNGLLYTESNIITYFEDIKNHFQNIKSTSFTEFKPFSFYSEWNYEIILNTIWTENFITDYNESYIINQFIILFEMLENFGWDTSNNNTLTIRVNSSGILDKIINKGNYSTTIKDKFKIWSQWRKGENTEFNKDVVKADLQYFKKKYDKNYWFKEINHILDIFGESDNNNNNNENTNFSIYWSNTRLLKKYKELIKIDFSLVSEHFLFYSGLIFQVVYKYNNEEIILVEGGRIDNLWNNNMKDFYYNGFSVRYFFDKIFKVKYRQWYVTPQVNSSQNEMKLDWLVLRSNSVSDEVIIEFENTVHVGYEIIKKPQVCDKINYMKYYKFYKMRLIVFWYAEDQNSHPWSIKIKTKSNPNLDDKDESWDKKKQDIYVKIDLISKDFIDTINDNLYFKQLLEYLKSFQFKNRKGDK